jgi:hypothetical protein
MKRTSPTQRPPASRARRIPIRTKFMNQIERIIGLRREARVTYLDNDIRNLDQPGEPWKDSHKYFVRCAVTQKMIALEELKYWSVDRQEAYIDAAASLTRHRAVQAT